MQKPKLRLFPVSPAPPTIDLGTQFCTVVGIPVLPTEPTQVIKDPIELYKQGKQSGNYLIEVMIAACRHAGIPLESMKRAKSKGMERFTQKVITEKKGHPELVTDIARGEIETDDVDALLGLSDFFRPSNNRKYSDIFRTARFRDNISRPDESKMGLRRARVVVELANSHLAEVQFHHKGYSQATKRTHALYKEARLLEASYGDDVSKWPPEVKQKYNEIQKRRQHIHDGLAVKFGLTDLVEHRRFYLTGQQTRDSFDDIPFMLVERKRGNLRIAVRPDIESGHYVIDNNLLDKLSSEGTPISSDTIEIDRESFLISSMKKVYEAKFPFGRPLEFKSPG
jgi:hypothetical protein